MSRTQSQAIHENIMKRVLVNKSKYHKRARFQISDAIEEYNEMARAKSPSCVTDTMNIADTQRQRAYNASLEKPAQQQAHAEPTGAIENIGKAGGEDSYRVAKSHLAVDNQGSAGMATDASATPDMPLSREIRAVDAKDVSADFGWQAGSYPGDTRAQAKGNTDPLKGNDTPVRSQMGQQKSSKFDSDTEPFSSPTAGSEGDRA